MGHARILAGLKSPSQQKTIRDLIVKRALSVRQAEELVRREKSPPARKKEKQEESYYMQSLADELKRSLGTKVEIRKAGKKGSIIIHFYSDDELNRLLEFLS